MCACMFASIRFVQAMTSAFTDGFQNYLTQVFVLEEGRLMIKVTFEGHIN